MNYMATVNKLLVYRTFRLIDVWGRRLMKMKINFFHSLVYVLIITIIIPGIVSVAIAADEDIPFEDDGNSTVLLPDLVLRIFT